MTLVVCWTNDDEVICAADSRLSSDPSTTLSDTGTKVLVIPVSYKTLEGNKVTGEGHYSLGFTYCGSSLLAQNAHAIASTCCQIMHSTKADAVPPASLVAKVYSKVAEYVTKDMNSRLHDSFQYFHAMIFGYCPKERRLKIFMIEPHTQGNAFSVRFEELPVEQGRLFAMGSGRDEFMRRIGIKDSLGRDPKILDVFLSVMEGGRIASVGGYPQIATANKFGVEVSPILTQSQHNLDAVTMTINGFDVAEINDSEGFLFGLKARGIGVEKVSARAALKAKGLDPDGPPVSRKVQNTASFELALRAAASKGVELSIDQNYSLAASTPAMGCWYCAAKCRCGQMSPFCLAPAAGLPTPPLIGPGRVNYQCWNCGSSISASSDDVQIICWNLPLGPR